MKQKLLSAMQKKQQQQHGGSAAVSTAAAATAAAKPKMSGEDALRELLKKPSSAANSSTANSAKERMAIASSSLLGTSTLSTKQSIRSSAADAAGALAGDATTDKGLSPLEQRRAQYLAKKRNASSKAREEETLQKLQAFMTRIRGAQSTATAAPNASAATDAIAPLIGHRMHAKLRPQDFEALRKKADALAAEHAAASGMLDGRTADFRTADGETALVARGIQKTASEEDEAARRYLYQDSQIIVIDEREERLKRQREAEAATRDAEARTAREAEEQRVIDDSIRGLIGDDSDDESRPAAAANRGSDARKRRRSASRSRSR
jgi:hypothetical protein